MPRRRDDKPRDATMHIAEQLGGYLRCELCGHDEDVRKEYFHSGFPAHCGQTMRWCTDEQIADGRAPARRAADPAPGASPTAPAPVHTAPFVAPGLDLDAPLPALPAAGSAGSLQGATRPSPPVQPPVQPTATTSAAGPTGDVDRLLQAGQAVADLLAWADVPGAPRTDEQRLALARWRAAAEQARRPGGAQAP